MEQQQENKDDQFLNYLEGSLDAQEAHAFEKALFGDEDAHKRLDEYKTVIDGMESAPVYMPKNELTTQFFETLQQEKERAKGNMSTKIVGLWKSNWWLQIAAAVLLFFVGYAADKQISIEELRTAELSALREEITNNKHMIMLSMLEQQSASKRIQAVNYSYEMPEADEKLVEALLHTMNYDENLNVRMAATEALFRFANKEPIRMAMIHSLKEQKDPEMQLMLIDMLTKLKEHRALGVFQDLAKQEDLMELVKVKANEGLEVLL